MKNSFVFLVFSGLLCSCMSERDEVSYTADPAAVSCPFTVAVDVPDGAGKMTRSSFSDVDCDRITDLNVFVYHQGRLLSECCRYFDDMSSPMLSFPADRDGFGIYMVGNVGRVLPPDKESELGDLRCVLPSYAEFRAKGFPVAERFLDYRRGDPAHFKVKRLVGQYDISMRVSADDAEYVVKDVRLKNCARDMCPFGSGVPAEVFTCSCNPDDCCCGDYLTDSDVAKLNAGETVTLYFVENVQGVLLPDNTDRKKKIPSSLNGVDGVVADRCTYLEITADVTTSSARYHDGKYRFYLGQDLTTDFSIKRNTLYSVTLDFTQNMVSEEEWRIEVDAPDFVPVKFDKEEAMVVKGAEDMIYVQAYDHDGALLDFDVEVLSSNGYVNVQKVANKDYREQSALGKSLGLKFTSNVDIDGLYSFEEEPDCITEIVRVSSKETYNGRPVYFKDIPVRIYHKLFPLLIKLEKGDCYLYPGQGMTVYNVVLRGRNPMGLALKVDTEYYYGDSAALGRTSQYCYNSYDADGGINTGDGKTRQGAVTPEGVYARYLGTVVTGPDDLSRVDFFITGKHYDAGLAHSGGSEASAEAVFENMTYPRLRKSAAPYMGVGVQATYGPGMKPMSFPGLTSGQSFWVQVRPYDDGEYTRVIGIGLSETKLSETFYDPIELSVMSKDGSKLFYQIDALGDGMGIVNFVGTSSYEDCPFYFMNGVMCCTKCSVSLDCSAPKYEKNASVCRITAQYNVPGRDLFLETKGDSEYMYHESGFSMKSWHTITNKLQTEQTGKYYNGKFFMTVNGASTWVGGAADSEGCFMEQY